MSLNPDIDPARGVLLVAAANLLDPNFSRTVVLLCEHKDEGTFGLVLNRELPISLADVVADSLGWDAPIFRGGPVQENTLHFIHRCPELAEQSEEVAPGIFWGGDFDRVAHMIKHNKLSAADFRFFVGYSGWGEEQLDGELKQKSWYLRQAIPELVFPADLDNLWRNTLKSMGSAYQLLSNFPDDPRLN